jgi:esterase/lipase superfamily enzyme
LEILSVAETPDRLGYSRGNYFNAATNLLIHGYHNSAEDVNKSYEELQTNLGHLCFGLHWPGMRLFIEFPTAIKNATQSGWRLKDLLLSVNKPEELTIQTHSLGARVACEALNYDIKIHRLILSAPAIHKNSFSAEFERVLKNVDRIDVAFSMNDPVLKTQFPLGTFGQPAMGRYGSETSAPNLFNHDFSDLVHSHGGYKSCKEYFSMWNMLEGTNS